jgi:predicted amidohydrolase
MRVAAVQLAFSYASTPQEFSDRVREPVERAVGEGAAIVVLPNYTGLMLLGMLVPAAGGEKKQGLAEIAIAGGYASAAAMLHQAADTMREFYLHVFGSLAKRLVIHLLPGSVIEQEGNRLFNTAYLIGPDGKVVGSQRQTHRTQEQIGWGFAQGDVLRVFDIGTARIGIVLGEDVAYPEVSRILALQKADLLVHPAAYREWSDEHYLLDLWREVQSNQVFGIQACAVGEQFTGRSAVYAPAHGTQDHRGILAQAAAACSEDLVSAVLDPAVLEKAKTGLPIFDLFNCGLYARELPEAYRSGIR